MIRSGDSSGSGTERIPGRSNADMVQVRWEVRMRAHLAIVTALLLQQRQVANCSNSVVETI